MLPDESADQDGGSTMRHNNRSKKKVIELACDVVDLELGRELKIDLG